MVTQITDITDVEALIIFSLSYSIQLGITKQCCIINLYYEVVFSQSYYYTIVLLSLHDCVINIIQGCHFKPGFYGLEANTYHHYAYYCHYTTVLLSRCNCVSIIIYNCVIINLITGYYSYRTGL